MPNVKLILDIQNYRGDRVIFTEDKWLEKQTAHPELKNQRFLKNVKKTIIDPDEVWKDYSDPHRKVCYYKKYSVGRYVKVVVWIKSNPNQVITAYDIDHVKETKYPGLKRVK